MRVEVCVNRMKDLGLNKGRHSVNQLNGWLCADIHQAILTSFALSSERYTLTQLRYDLRKMKAHGLLERIGTSYRYRLSDKDSQAALLLSVPPPCSP